MTDPVQPRGCPNCGTAVTDRYCPHCGQEQTERLVSVRRMVRDLLEDTLSLESRLPRTLGSLLFRPGFLTREYTVGRIARYLHPFWLYVVASIVFFLALSLVADFDALWRTMGERIEAAADDRWALVRSNIDIEKVPAPLAPVARAWLREEAELNALGRREGVRVLYEATVAAVPPIVFLLVPLFALVLKGLYRPRMFAEHAIFVLHFHALGFLVAAIGLLLHDARAAAILAAALAAWLFLALRRVYGAHPPTVEPVWRTTLKYTALLFTYLIAFAVTVFAVMIVAVISA